MVSVSFEVGPSLERRFLAAVNRRGGDECWPWGLTCNEKGYGLIRDGDRNRRATHVALILDGKARPSLRHGALHSCDNPPCCNPAHLRWGTAAENNTEMAARGRCSKRAGRLNAAAILNEEQVRAIRASSLPNRALALQFGVRPVTIRAVRIGQTWAETA